MQVCCHYRNMAFQALHRSLVFRSFHNSYRHLRVNKISWSKWHHVRTLHKSRCYTTVSDSLNRDIKVDRKPYTAVPEWTKPFSIRDPELNLEYLLDPDNLQEISENIVNRKGVGNIVLLTSLMNGDFRNRWEKAESETERMALRRECLEVLRDIPNRSHPDVPVGEEDQARQVELVGGRREFDFKPRTMVQLGERLGILRTENTYPTTGHTTYYFIDKLAMLEQALIRFTTDRLKQKGFELISVPDLIHPDIIESCGFKTTGEVTQVYRLDRSYHGDVCLAGTSEMPLAGYFYDSILKKEELPVKLAAISRCYRAETSGVEHESGIYRVHQFTKVEMFGVTDSDREMSGNDFLLELIDIQKSLFTELGLHFRVLDMPTAELGAPASRKFDMEAWMPAKQFWGEISSASNCTDYQSRRLHIKYRDANDAARFCHTVNGTACALPRTIMAICENFQDKDGSIRIPDVLQDYMGGETVIRMSDKVPRLEWIKSNKLKK